MNHDNLTDLNGIYYFFSTLAQTLAAMCGFLATFVILRLTTWDNKLAWSLARLSEFHRKNGTSSRSDKLIQQCYDGRPEEALKLVDDFPVDKTDLDSLYYLKQDAHDAVGWLVRIWPLRKKVVGYFWLALALAGIAILMALVALPLSRLIVVSHLRVCVILLIEWILIVTHIVFLWLLLRNCIGAAPE